MIETIDISKDYNAYENGDGRIILVPKSFSETEQYVCPYCRKVVQRVFQPTSASASPYDKRVVNLVKLKP
jgi:hypothetical protein